MILFTSPQPIEGEIELINHLFKLGLSTLHLRKPDFTLALMEAYIEGIEPQYRDRVMLHSHLELIERFPLKGVHFSERNKPLFDKYRNFNVAKSWSSHKINELASIPKEVDYTFLSPIFSSISKSGYETEWDFELLSTTLKQRKNQHTKVYALGGISLENAPRCKELGFDDFAILGSLWQPFEHNKDIQLTSDIFLQINSL